MVLGDVDLGSICHADADILPRTNDSCTRYPSFTTSKQHQTHHRCVFRKRWRWQVVRRGAARFDTLRLVRRCEDRDP